MPRQSERGVILLEVLVALSILATAVVSLVALHDAGLRAQARAAAEEAVVTDADRLLTALSLLTGAEYTQRLGTHPVGPYLVDIQRPEPGLFRIGLRLAAEPASELLATVVYRPEAGR